MNNLERRTFNFEFRAEGDESTKIAGYGAVFDSLSENLGGFRELIAPGAFDDVLEDDVRALFNHDSNLILGRNGAKTLSISVDKKGLRYEVDMPETSYAKDLMVSIQRGDVSQSSFGFIVETDSWDEDDDGRLVRTVHKIKRLLDVSPVTYPAYHDTQAAARSMDAYKDSKKNEGKAQLQVDAENRDRELQRLKVR